MPKAKAKEADKAKKSSQKRVDEPTKATEEEKAQRIEKTANRLQDGEYLSRDLDTKKLLKRLKVCVVID